MAVQKKRGVPLNSTSINKRTKLLLIALVAILYVLHQDFWFWRESRPLILGFLPVGLFYHIVYTLAVAAVMALLVKLAWPTHLESEETSSKP